jgi:hypothetical protein
MSQNLHLSITFLLLPFLLEIFVFLISIKFNIFENPCRICCEIVLLTHQVPRNFFSNFSTIFGYNTPQDPQKPNPEIFFFFFQPKVPFSGMDKKDRLVLTGVWVTNFLIYEYFCLKFLHSIHGNT